MKRFLFLLLVALCTAYPFSARADILKFTINSAGTFDGSFYVGQYNSSYTNQDGSIFVPIQSFCIDFTDHVSFGEEFDVTAVNLANFSGPLQQNYWEAGWLALQIQNTTDVATISAMQRAIWLITTPGSSDPYLTTTDSFGWVLQAQQNYQSVAASDFVLFLKSGDVGQNQLAVVPEPSVFALGAVGVLSLLGLKSWTRRTARA